MVRGAQQAVASGAVRPISTRFKHNARLAAVLDEPGQTREDWGDLNFFTWDEVTQWKIGWFATVATGGECGTQ